MNLLGTEAARSGNEEDPEDYYASGRGALCKDLRGLGKGDGT